MALWCVSAGTAQAQEPGDTGLTISVPSAIGMIWHASDRLAIRPDFGFGFNGSDGEGVGPDSSAKNFTVGLSALLYTHRWEELRLYVSPRFVYSYGSTSTERSVLGDSTQSSWGVTGSVGGQYALGTRFGVFAEAGVGYATQTSESGSPIRIDRTTWTFGTRTAIGGMLYF
jgi:hypothetical protein